MREPPRRRGARRPCEQMMSRQWRRPSWMRPGKATVGTAALLVVGSFSEEEEDLLIKLHALLGNRWSLIAGRLPGRTGDEVKTYWDSQMRTKLKRMGIDPDNDRRVHPDEWEEHRANHPTGHSPASSEDDHIAADAAGGDDDDCALSDAGSSNRARQGHRLAELNLELTLSTPCASSSEIERTRGATVN